MPEVKLKEWLRMARSTEMVLMILNNEEAMYYRTSNLREQTQADATAVTRTAFQQIHEVIHFHDRMSAKYGEKLGAKKVAKLYAEHVKQRKAWKKPEEEASSKTKVPDTEIKSERMIEDALTIGRRALSVPEVNAVLRDADGRWGHSSLFDSVAKIAGLLGKGKVQQYPFLFESIHHMVLTEQMEVSEFSFRGLLGDSRSKGIPYFEVILLKQRFLHHLLSKWLPSKGCPGEVVSVLHDKVTTPAMWRLNVSPAEGPLPSMSWKQVSRICLQFLFRF